jgi:hypothetical protein
MINNDRTGFTIIKKRNHKRSIKLQGGARKRSKNKLSNSIYHSDSELTSEIEIKNANKDSETVGAKIGTLKINSVNIITEILIY